MMHHRRQMVRLIWLAVANALFLILTGCPKSSETNVPENIKWPDIFLSRKVAGLSLPVHLTHAADGSRRIFVVEQAGRIRIIHSETLLGAPFLDITDRVSCCDQRGLLSVAFPPDYANKGYFYVNYTNQSGKTVIARYHITGDINVANPKTEEVILTVDQPRHDHNGGQLAFGPDGYLYIGMGDGGSLQGVVPRLLDPGDPDNLAQNPDSLLGKILRIDVESESSPYAIPSSNPFIKNPAFRNEIWALGLRNPWRFSFDRKSGDLYIADVGHNSYEEIDFQPASSLGGENYGWRIMEGTHCYNPDPCNPAGLVPPVSEYNHSQGCSIIGGMVYRGQEYWRMQGIYFYSDYCNQGIWGLRFDGVNWKTQLLMKTAYIITTFGEDESSNLYLVDYSKGDVFKLGDLLRSPPSDP